MEWIAERCAEAERPVLIVKYMKDRVIKNYFEVNNPGTSNVLYKDG